VTDRQTDRRTDGQTDTLPNAKSHSSIAERDENYYIYHDETFSIEHQ